MKEQVKKEISFFDKFKTITFLIIGTLIFFIPIKSNGEFINIYYMLHSYIKLNHISFVKASVLVLALLGSIRGIYKTQNKNDHLRYFRIISVIILFSLFYSKKELFSIDNTTTTLLNEISVSIFISLLIGSVFAQFIDFLVEVFEFLFSKISKVLFDISGRGVFCVVMFLITDSFFGLFLLNKLFKEGKLRQKEGAMILLNFFFMPLFVINIFIGRVNISKLDFLFSSTLVLIIVNFLMCRIYPISKKKKSYNVKNRVNNKKYKDLNEVFEYVVKKDRHKNISKELKDDLQESIEFITQILPDIVILTYVSSSILGFIHLENIFVDILKPLMEFLKYDNYSEILSFVFLNLLNGFYALNHISLNILYDSKVLIMLIFSFGSISIIKNILFKKVTKIQVSYFDFFATYFLRTFLIIVVYSLIIYIKRGYLILG
ncbi:MAG: hypothetical protein R3Y64_04670 [Peptostreptococcaceae bacterium]